MNIGKSISNKVSDTVWGSITNACRKTYLGNTVNNYVFNSVRNSVRFQINRLISYDIAL